MFHDFHEKYIFVSKQKKNEIIVFEGINNLPWFVLRRKGKTFDIEGSKRVLSHWFEDQQVA